MICTGFEPVTHATAAANVWLINYITTNVSFTVNVINVGKDPLDSISGTLRKFNLNKQTFTQASSITFTKKQAGSGPVYTWSQPRNAVSDFFQYEVKVIEDNTVSVYNNKSESIHTHKYQRYLSDARAYSKMTALGGERHHFVSSSTLVSAGGYSTTTAPAIRMTQKDHYKTPSWGSSATAVAFRAKELSLLKAKKFQELVQLEINGLKAASDPDNKYSNLATKYNDYILSAIVLSEQYFGFVSSK